MRWKILAAVWIITVVAIWIVGALVEATIVSSTIGSDIEGGELIMTYLTDPMKILTYVVVGSILTPCCYGYGKMTDQY